MVFLNSSQRVVQPKLSIQTVLIKTACRRVVLVYCLKVPKLWNETIEAHRQTVQDAILDAAHTLARERGITSVRMSEIATTVGIGRATLYKYFPDVESILVARHKRHVAMQLRKLEELRDQTQDPSGRLRVVLTGYAFIAHHRKEHGATDISALVHRPENISGIEQQLTDLIAGVLADAADAGIVRVDTPSEELAAFALHALTAAAALPDAQAIHRLVAVVTAGLK